MSGNEASQQANRAQMDPRRLVVVAYLVFAIILALFLGSMLELAFASLNLGNARVIEGLDFKVTDIVGVVVTLGAGAWCWTNPRINTLSMEVATELMRVTWPSWDETRVSTIAVILASIIASLILFGMDTFAYKLMVNWLPFLWGKL